jgi:hypothetical protein
VSSSAARGRRARGCRRRRVGRRRCRSAAATRARRNGHAVAGGDELRRALERLRAGLDGLEVQRLGHALVRLEPLCKARSADA